MEKTKKDIKYNFSEILKDVLYMWRQCQTKGESLLKETENIDEKNDSFQDVATVGTNIINLFERVNANMKLFVDNIEKVVTINNRMKDESLSTLTSCTQNFILSSSQGIKSVCTKPQATNNLESAKIPDLKHTSKRSKLSLHKTNTEETNDAWIDQVNKCVNEWKRLGRESENCEVTDKDMEILKKELKTEQQFSPNSTSGETQVVNVFENTADLKQELQNSETNKYEEKPVGAKEEGASTNDSDTTDIDTEEFENLFKSNEQSTEHSITVNCSNLDSIVDGNIVDEDKMNDIKTTYDQNTEIFGSLSDREDDFAENEDLQKNEDVKNIDGNSQNSFVFEISKEQAKTVPDNTTTVNTADNNPNNSRSNSDELLDLLKEVEMRTAGPKLPKKIKKVNTKTTKEADDVFKQLMEEGSSDISDDDSVSSMLTDTDSIGKVSTSESGKKENRTSVIKEADSQSNTLEERLKDRFGIKECYIDLVDCKGCEYKRRKSSSDSIDRLCDLNNLSKRKRHNSHQSSKRKNLKKATSTNKSDDTEVYSDTTDVDVFSGSDDERVKTPVNVNSSLVDPNELLANILLDSIEILSSDSSDEELNSTAKEKKKHKRSTERISKKKKLSKEEREKKRWMNDPLLRDKLSSPSDDSSSDKPKRNGFQTKYEQDDDFKLSSDSSCSSDKVSTTSGKKSIKRGQFPKAELTDSSSDTDIEIVTPKKENTSENDFETVNKKGRRNIRALMGDENLAEATQQAKLEEEERIQRLQEKQKHLETFASQHSNEDLEEFVLDVDKETSLPLITVDKVLTKRLKPHQMQGVQFMWDACYETVKRLKEHAGSGCILAHCMGLGKTFQVITLIHTLFTHPVTNTRHVLVVCPLSTVNNWKNEFKIAFELFKEKVNIQVFSICTKKESTRKFDIVNKWYEKTGVLLLGYEAFEVMTNTQKTDALSPRKRNKTFTSLLDPGPDLIVCDEGHILRNQNTQRTVALMKVKTKRRIVLTGTPLQNNLNEYYHMVQFVKPNLLGTLREYKTNFVNPITNGQYDDSTVEDIRLMKKRTHVLHKLLKKSVQRVEVSELKMYLPRILDFALFIQLSPTQVELYKKYLDLATFDDKHIQRKWFLNDYKNIKYICGHPKMLRIIDKIKSSPSKRKEELDVDCLEPEVNEAKSDYDDWWKEICPDDVDTNLNHGTKFVVLKSILEEAEVVGDKVLLFSQSLVEMDCVEYFLQLSGTASCPSWKKGVDYFRMDGTVPPEIRTSLCDQFNDRSNTKLRLFIMSHKVGGLGLNLTAANRVILMGVNFNPSYDTQSVYRAYRFGQEKQCFIYRLISRGTMEEKVYQRSVTKLAIASRVLDKHQITRHYKSMELQEMYRFDVDLREERPVPNVPEDTLLAKILLKLPSIFQYHSHEALLENRPEEDLNETEKNSAWEEFNKINEQPIITSLGVPSAATGGHTNITSDMFIETMKYKMNNSYNPRSIIQKQPIPNNGLLPNPLAKPTSSTPMVVPLQNRPQKQPMPQSGLLPTPLSAPVSKNISNGEQRLARVPQNFSDNKSFPSTSANKINPYNGASILQPRIKTNRVYQGERVNPKYSIEPTVSSNNHISRPGVKPNFANLLGNGNNDQLLTEQNDIFNKYTTQNVEVVEEMKKTYNEPSNDVIINILEDDDDDDVIIEETDAASESSSLNQDLINNLLYGGVSLLKVQNKDQDIITLD